MRCAARWLCALVLWAGVAAADDPPAAPGGPVVVVMRVEGAIGPATSDHIRRGLKRAEELDARLAVVQFDTPGGLDTAMRDIIKAILASPVPVASFVSPQGARAASAGTYILYASHVAAMAPATNLGAATPVAIGLPMPGGQPDAQPGGRSPPASAPDGGASAPPPPPADAMTAKRLNDAVAYIRGLALLRERNAEWAERAVRESVSLTATDALKQRVIDLIAVDVPDLLNKVDGRVVQVLGRPGAPGREVKLATAKASIVMHEPDWRGKLLATISDPSVALVLLMIGIYGLLFEFASPGFVVPGVIGGVCLLLGLYGLQTLPINYAGLALLLLGIAFLVAEAFLPSFGVLGLGGIAAFAFGALMLIDSEVPGFGVPISLIVALTISSAVFLVGVIGMAARARQRPVVSGHRLLAGATGELVEVDGVEGWAEIQGERWRVRGTGGLLPGQRVRVARVDGLTLDVVPNGEGN